MARRADGLAIAAALFLAGVLPVTPNRTPYPKGSYQAADGRLYRLTSGPAALSIQGPNDLCLLFWDQEDPPRDRQLIDLRGQSCSNRTFGDLDWVARYDVARTEKVLLTHRADGGQSILLAKRDIQ